MPWVFDWGALDDVEIDAAIQMRQLLRTWASSRSTSAGWRRPLPEPAQGAAPVGERDTDPALWMLRWRRCAWPTGPTSSTKPPSTTA
jgi:hypothetical protein